MPGTIFSTDVTVVTFTPIFGWPDVGRFEFPASGQSLCFGLDPASCEAYHCSKYWKCLGMAINTIREMTLEEGKLLLDQQARRYLNMSGEDFIQSWERGDFDNKPERPEVVRLAMLIPFST